MTDLIEVHIDHSGRASLIGMILNFAKERSQASIFEYAVRVRSIFFGWAPAARQALHSRELGPRMFSKPHPMAGRGLAPAFGQWRPAPLSRFRTMQLQALSAMPDPTGRGRSAFGPCRPRRCGCRDRSRCGFRLFCPASSCFLTLSIHAFRLPRPPTARCRCGRRPHSRSCLPRLPGLRVPAVAGLRRAVRLLAGRALDTPESRHVSLIERPSRKWARRISPILLSTPSIPASLSRINGRAVARIIERGRP